MIKILSRLLYTILSMVCFLGHSQNSKISNSNMDANDPSIVKYAKTITAEELKEALYTFASDEFKGRFPGSKGDKKALKFLKKFYRSHNIPSPLGKNNYYQEVPLLAPYPLVRKLRIGHKSYNEMDFAVYGGIMSLGEIKGDEIVYVGEGIETEEFSSYNNLNVEGKIVLIREEGDWNQEKTELVSKKIEIAKNKGAKLVLICNEEFFKKYKKLLTNKKRVKDSESVQLLLEEYPFPKGGVKCLVINKNIGKSILPSIETDNSTQTIRIPFSFKIKKKKAKKVSANNLIAFIKGSEKPEEVIVMTAHLDHLGITENGDISNGADDNGSGSVALLEIAEAFKKAVDNGYRPKRSIAFLHVTAEEAGLLGSAYYTDAPVFPLENTVVNLNIDMLGRIDKKHEGKGNYVYLIGSEVLSKELQELSIETNNQYTNLELDFSLPNLYNRTDSYSFINKNIPSIFFFGGFHGDYHRISDTPEKIAYNALEARTRLVFYIAWELANREERIKLDNP